MTIWNHIYKNYQNGGEARATLSEDIHPLFEQFLNQLNLEIKHVLDIGCGNGKYLKTLQLKGFKTDGIDSSETAIEMTKEILDNDSVILCVDMFEFKIPKNKYDLIISISTVHHGTKDEVQNLINRIYIAMIDGGKAFITVPDLGGTSKNGYLKDNEDLGNGTFAPLIGLEKGLPHSFYTEKEVYELFSEFNVIKLELDDIGRWVVQAFK